jgi:hypothetical protein
MPIKIFSREAAKSAKRRVLNSIPLRVFAPSRETIFSRIIHHLLNPNAPANRRRDSDVRFRRLFGLFY